MPRAFSDQEESSIRDQLRSIGSKLFAAQGVSKTSIEQITQSVGIAKGSFYKFYPTKELLFFELLECRQNAIRAPFLDNNIPKQKRTREHLEQLVSKLFTQLCSDPLVQLMGQEREILAIRRKVPVDTLMAHQKADQEFLARLIERWNHAQAAPERDKVAACMTLLVLLSLNQEFVGERLLPHAAAAAICSLVDCFFGPKIHATGKSQ